MLKVQLTEREREELKRIAKKEGDRRKERVVAVLMNDEGRSAVKIAEFLGRSYETVKRWIKKFISERGEGLRRKYSTGRRSIRNTKLKPLLEIWLEESPGRYGFNQSLWDIDLIIAAFKKETNCTISRDSVERALKENDYSYKKPKKTVPLQAPSKEEKIDRVEEIISEIKTALAREDVEVIALDESHFSTEPYLVRGWHKKGKLFFVRDCRKRETCTLFGAFHLKTSSFYWKSAAKGNARTFKEFLWQLKMKFKNKKVFLIMDNVNYHKSAIINKFLLKYSNFKFCFLPTYSPEYNPVEQVWKWLKKSVHDSKTINGGISELLTRVRKTMRAKIYNRSLKPLNVGIGIWNTLYNNNFAV